MTRLGLTAAVLAVGALLCSSNANAALITVNAGPNPGSFTLFSSGFPTVTYSGTSAPFVFVTGSADVVITAPGTGIFDSDNVSFTTSGPATLFVWITLSGITAPPGDIVALHSGLTTNDLSGGISSVTLSTLLDPTNGVAPPVGSVLIDSHTFTAPGTKGLNTEKPTGPGPFSLQEVYEIQASRAGNTNLTIDITASALPEPTTLALLGTGLLAGVAVLRRRRG